MTKRYSGWLLGIVAAVAAVAAQAAWGPVPQYIGDNLPVVQDNERYAKAIPDGTGGTFMVWVASDAFDPELRVYGQRVSGDGRKLWNRTDPKLLAGEPGVDFGNLGLSSDGQGGIFAAWQRLDGSAPVGPVLVSRIAADGSSVWTVPARVLDGAAEYLLSPAGDGGASILGSVAVPAGESFRAARLSATGTPVFERVVHQSPAGTSLHASPAVLPGARPGEALYFLSDRSRQALPGVNAVSVRADGSSSVSVVSASGGLHPTDHPNCHRFLSAAADGKGGAWVAWIDVGARDAVYLARVGADGKRDGKPVLVDDDRKTDKFNVFAAADGKGGVYLQYATDVAGALDASCKSAQKHAFSSDLWLWRFASAAGEPAWVTRVGATITDDGHQVLPSGGDAYSAWVDQPTRNVLARRIGADGRPATVEPVIVGSYEGAGSLGITLMPGQDGGVVVGWKQSENLYVQTVAPEGDR